jgi:transcriptional regulator with XRE-family HTH domain
MSKAGTMLRLARQLRGFPQNEAAECLRLPNTELSRIENGLKEPTAQLLETAAEIFSVPVEFFGQTDAIYGAPISVHAPMWRKKANVSATELHRIVAELNVRVMHLRKLLEATDLDPVNKLPRFDADEYDNDAEKIAGLLRRFWQVPDGPSRTSPRWSRKPASWWRIPTWAARPSRACASPCPACRTSSCSTGSSRRTACGSRCATNSAT